MAQHDYVISNGTGAAVRSDLNNALLAIVSQNSGATEPTTTYAYQWWADTTTGLLKIRNSANNGWITLRELDGTLTIEDGTVSAPGLAFRDDLNTGIWRPGTDQFAISTNGVERVEWGTSEVVFNDAGNNYDFRVEGDNNANLLFVDASADAVGIGTSTPGSLLHLNVATAASDGTKGVRIANPAGTAAMFECGSSNDSYIGTLSGSDFSIRTNNTSRIYVTNGGNVGIGTVSPSDTSVFGKALDVNGTTGAACYVRTNGSATNFGLIGHYGTDFYVSNNSNGPIRFFANADERARIDSSGRLLVGTSTARTNVDGYAPIFQAEVAGSSDASNRLMSFTYGRNSGSGGGVFAFNRHSSITVGGQGAVADGYNLGQIRFNGSDGTNFIGAAEIKAEVDGTPGANDMPGRIILATTADGASSPTERMRIDNGGNVMVGMTSNNYLAADSGIILQSNGVARFGGDGTSARNIISFVNGTDGTPAEVGRIQTNGSATSYLTSSDYRLKENVISISDGIDRLKQLKPSRFNFLIEPAKTVDGFIAHEVQGIVPEAIDGEKDAVDADGNPVYQGIDQSKLVPLLTAALQEAIAKIESLEARLTAAGI